MATKQIIATLGHMTFVPPKSRYFGKGAFDFIVEDKATEPPTKERLVVLELSADTKKFVEVYRKPGFTDTVKPAVVEVKK
jgi:hypothetical protein